MKKIVVVEGKHDKIFFENLFKKFSIKIEIKIAGNNTKIPRLVGSKHFNFDKIFVFIDSNNSTGSQIIEKIKNRVYPFIAEKDLEGFISRDKECSKKVFDKELIKECTSKYELEKELGRALIDKDYKEFGENFNPGVDKDFYSFLGKVRDP